MNHFLLGNLENSITLEYFDQWKLLNNPEPNSNFVNFRPFWSNLRNFSLKCPFPVGKSHFTISGKCATLLFHTHHKCYLNFYSKYRFQLSFLCCIFQQASYVLIILVVDIIVFIITTIIPQLLCQIANYVTYHLAFTNTTLGTLCTYYKITKKLATPVELNFFRFPRNSLVMLRKGIMFLALRWRHVSAFNAPDVRKNMNYLAN